MSHSCSVLRHGQLAAARLAVHEELTCTCIHTLLSAVLVHNINLGSKVGCLPQEPEDDTSPAASLSDLLTRWWRLMTASKHVQDKSAAHATLVTLQGQHSQSVLVQDQGARLGHQQHTPEDGVSTA